MNVRARVLNDCVTRLNALGLQYVIIDDNGTHHGTLKVAAEKERKGPKTISWEKDYGFKDKVLNSKVGEVIEFYPLEGHMLNDLQSQIASSAVRNIGKGTFATCTNKELMRVEFMRLK